jgi:hypothetical protein
VVSAFVSLPAAKLDEVWTVSASEAAETVRLTLHLGPPRPLVATLSKTELARVADILPAVAKAVRRGEFSRVQLGTMFQATIGRDPFKQVTVAAPRSGLFPWWADLANIIVGLGFAAQHSMLWLRIAGWAVATVALTDLVGQAWGWLRASRR